MPVRSADHARVAHAALRPVPGRFITARCGGRWPEAPECPDEDTGERRRAHHRGGLAALRAEIGELESVGRREVAARILTARGHGDLKENSEYHAAKEDRAHLETRILRLRQRWRNAVVVHVAESPGAALAFGRSAEVHDEDTGVVHVWTIVGATETDRAQGKLSVESPVAKALLGHVPALRSRSQPTGRSPTHN